MLSSPTTASSTDTHADQPSSTKASKHGVLSSTAPEFVPGGSVRPPPPGNQQQPPPRTSQQTGGRGQQQHRGGRAAGGRRDGGGRDGRDGRDGGAGRGGSGGLSRALQEGGARDHHSSQNSPRPHHGQHGRQQRRGSGGQQQQQQPAQQQQQQQRDAAADGAQLRPDLQPNSQDTQQAQRQGAGRGSGGVGDAGSGTGAGRSGGAAPAGRGRQVANHLLNFQYETRGPARGGRGGRGGPGAGGSYGRPRRPPAYNRPQRYDKDKFLQANFRFLVSGAVDTKQFDGDADRMFDWEDVLLVDMRSSTPVQCPISLDSPPVCPQITPCGHVFSFGSIMRHLMTHGGEQLRRSAPCPLCYQPLVARELRLVQIHHVQPPAVGDTITFQLLRRPKGSIIPLPVAAAQGTDTEAAAAAQQDTASGGSSAPAGPAGDAALGGLDSSGSGSALAAGKWAARKASAAAGTAAGAPAAATGAAASPGAAVACKAVAYSSVSTPLLENLFAKFATLPDPRALWRAAARELGQQLAEVLAQGGLEADFEAPGLFAAADCLAQRARRFAEHQATQLQQRGVPVGAAPAVPPGGSSGSTAAAAVAAGWPVWLAADPQAAGQEADALIRDAFTLAIDSGKAALTAAEQEQAVAAEFPSLAATAGSPPAQASAGRRPPPGSSPPSGASPPSAAKAFGSAAAPAVPASAQPPQQQQQAPVQAPATPECAAPIERHSSRTELFFDHAFSEDEDQEQQQQQDAAGQGEEPPTPQLTPEDSSSAGGGGGPAHSSARSIPAQLSAVAAADGSGAAAGLFGTSPGTSGLLGSSPTSSALNSASLSGDYYMYQAADGQWLFLHPLNLRCLLHAFGSYGACPSQVTGRVLELEDMIQDEGSRRRWKFLGHLPLNGTFRLGEVTFTQPALSPAQLAPMAEELAAREKRRRRRVEAAKRESRREAAAAAAAARARQGPTAAELRSMPRLGAAGDASAADAAVSAAAAAAGLLPAELQGLTPEQLEEALAAQAMHESAAAYGASPPSGGVSFARIAEMGFAATGPALGSSPAAAAAGSSASSSSAPAPAAAGAAAPLKGAWGAASSSGKSAAARLSSGAPAGSSGGGAGAGAAPAAALLTKSSWGAGGSGGTARQSSASGGAEGGAAGSSTSAAGAQQWLVLGGKEGGAGEGASEPGAAAASSSAGKKSKKGVVLFATGQQRRY